MSARSLPGLVLAALVGLGPAAAAAWPVLGEAQLTAGLRCFPDHEEAAVWWYAPERLELMARDGRPSFSFQRFRYTGSAGTGDSGTFWGRGVLSFDVRFAPAPEAVAAAHALLGRGRGAAVLRPLALERVEAVVLYAGPGEVAAGELPPGAWEGQGAVWSERSYVVGLEPASAQLLWEAYQRGGLAVSLSYGLVAKGLRARPAAAALGHAGEAAAPESLTFAGGALPIHVAPQECPACFQSTDLDAEIPAGYTFLDVYCHDFQSAAAPLDLGLVIVEVRAEAVSGDRPVEEARFRRADSGHAPIHFRFAVRLERGYEYRVSRVFDDGRVEGGDWARVAGWNGVLDVTRQAPAERRAALDARMLY